VKRLFRMIIAALVFTVLGLWAGSRYAPQLHELLHTVGLHGERMPPAQGAPAKDEAQPLYTCGMHPQVIQEGPGTCPICGMKLVPVRGNGDASARLAAAKGERKIKYWVAPMDPTYIRDAPGKSPMGMDLVPVYEDEEAAAEDHPNAIRIDPTVVQNMGVRTAVVVRRDLTRSLRTIGHVTEDENRLAEINTKVGGWIERLFVAETGQQVKKGDPLLTLYAPDLVTTQREYLLAMENLRKVEGSPFPEVAEGARRLLASARERLELWDISDAQIDRLEQTGKVERTLSLYSPFDGVVLERHATEGMYINPGQPLLKLADLSRIWVLADVYEAELPWVRPGTPAEMTLTYHPGQVFKGRLDYVYPTLDPMTRVVQVRLVFDNADGSLKPGMYADVTMTPRVAARVVAVPPEAVIHSGRRNLAFIALGDGRFESRELTLGPEGDDGYQVLAGLAEGEQVVTSAQFLLDSESQLKEAIAKLLQVRAAKTLPQEGGRGEGAGNERPAGDMSKQPAGTDRPHPNPPPGGEGFRDSASPRIVEQGETEAWSNAFTAYLAIQSALARDTVAGIPRQADALLHALQALSGDRGGAVTAAPMERVRNEIAGLRSDDLQVARGAFGPVSEVMLDLARGPGRVAAERLGLSAYHCPMSHANWLQQGEVANPYFGASMLRCGEPLGPEKASRE